MIQVASVVWAEIRKLLSRPVARFGLLLSALIGAFGPLALAGFANTPMEFQGNPVPFDRCAANALEWALTIRHWSWATQLLLAVLAAVSFAGELQSHTLREDLVRPVDRSVVLLAKWSALAVWSLASLLIQLAVGGALGLLLHGANGEQTMAHVSAAYAVSWPVEISFAAIALCAATLLRSVPGSIVALVLFAIFERMFTLLSVAARSFFIDNTGMGYVDFTPTTAWSVWTEMLSGATPSWQPWSALFVWTALAAVLAQWRFSRTDVP